MKSKYLHLFLIGILSSATISFAQDAGQAAKDAANATENGAKKAAKATGDAASKTADATKDAAQKTGEEAKDAANATETAQRMPATK